jgi:hypothetical protein
LATLSAFGDGIIGLSKQHHIFLFGDLKIDLFCQTDCFLIILFIYCNIAMGKQKAKLNTEQLQKTTFTIGGSQIQELSTTNQTTFAPPIDTVSVDRIPKGSHTKSTVQLGGGVRITNLGMI